MRADQVLFEKPVGDRELALYPVPIEEARASGLPSCWGIAPDGGLVVLRYAATSLHEGSGLDVTSEGFQDELWQVAASFVTAGIHGKLELNIAKALLPIESDELTLEMTADGNQQVSVVPMDPAVADGNWADVACWYFLEGRPVASGVCYHR